MKEPENSIKKLVCDKVEELNRPDLYRSPIIGFSSATDPRYQELKEIIGEWHRLPAEILPGAQSVISYFVPFSEKVAASPAKDENLSLWGEAYVIINDYFETINNSICELLNSMGYSASSFSYVEDTPEGEDPRAAWAQPPRTPWSHRSAALIAEIGTLGTNRLVITEKGSAGRFSTVFTSAVLSGHQQQNKAVCPQMNQKVCNKCISACPVNALSAEALNYEKCSQRCIKVEQLTGYKGATVCGRCISACPLAYIE